MKHIFDAELVLQMNFHQSKYTYLLGANLLYQKACEKLPI